MECILLDLCCAGAHPRPIREGSLGGEGCRACGLFPGATAPRICLLQDPFRPARFLTSLGDPSTDLDVCLFSL